MYANSLKQPIQLPVAFASQRFNRGAWKHVLRCTAVEGSPQGEDKTCTDTDTHPSAATLWLQPAGSCHGSNSVSTNYKIVCTHFYFRFCSKRSKERQADGIRGNSALAIHQNLNLNGGKTKVEWRSAAFRTFAPMFW